MIGAPGVRPVWSLPVTDPVYGAGYVAGRVVRLWRRLRGAR